MWVKATGLIAIGREGHWVPDEKDDDAKRPLPFPIVPIDPTADDALAPDPMSDEIENLEREAKPIQKLCPHCGKPLPKDE